MKILNTLKNNRQNLINNLIENIESLEKIAFEQQAEIERLKKECGSKEKAYNEEYCLRKEIKAENEKLREAIISNNLTPTAYKVMQENDEKYIHIINRQKAEIERLQEENKNHKAVIEAIEDTINPLPFETDFDKAIKTAKTEAIKEFAEFVFSLFPVDKNHTTISRFTIKQKLKEMVGDDDNA